MKNKIDLSKINIKKTPTQWIKANLEGEEKSYEIRALKDGEKINMAGLLAAGSKDVYRIRNLYVCLLSCGLEIEDDVAAALFDNNPAEATRVGDLIFKLSQMFETEKVKEAENAEKNSSGETKAQQE